MQIKVLEEEEILKRLENNKDIPVVQGWRLLAGKRVISYTKTENGLYDIETEMEDRTGVILTATVPYEYLSGLSDLVKHVCYFPDTGMKKSWCDCGSVAVFNHLSGKYE